jgi:serine/threonine protein kinase
MLQSVQHPFIINLWGVFQDAGNLYMVMDFVPGGELFTLLRRSNVFHLLFVFKYDSLFSVPSASLILLPSFTLLKLHWH